MNKVALVTGANRGIGLAIAKGLSEEGMTVLLGVRDINKGKELEKEIPNSAAVEIDLSNKDNLSGQIEKILNEHPKIDVLVNNAGIMREGAALSVSEADFLESLQVNSFAPFELIRHIAPLMTENGYGRIVNVSSGWGSLNDGLTGPAAYSISKATLNAITLSTSHSLPGSVKINSMCPGWVRTDMGGPAASRSPEKGAETAIWLATLPDDGPSGKFFRDKQEISW